MSTLGGSLPDPALGGISGGTFKLCCSSLPMHGTGGKMHVWNGFPKVVQDEFETVLFSPEDGSCWVDEVSKSLGLFAQVGCGGVEKAGCWVTDWLTLVMLGKMDVTGSFHEVVLEMEEDEGPRDKTPNRDKI